MFKETGKQTGYMLIAFAAFMLLFNLTWMPWVNWGYVTWAQESNAHIGIRILVGILIVGTIFWFANMAFRAKGLVGVVFFLIIFGLLVWVGIDTSVIPIQKDFLIELTYVIASLMMAIGLRTARVKRILSGQSHVEDPDSEKDD